MESSFLATKICDDIRMGSTPSNARNTADVG